MSAKKIVFFIILISSLFIINNLVHSIYTLWQKKHLVVDMQAEVEKEKQKKPGVEEQVEPNSKALLHRGRGAK